MHVSIFGVAVCSVLLVRRYPDLDRELDRFWYRR